MTSQLLRIRENFISLEHPKIIGILNITEDSFYDGKKYNKIKAAISQTEKMIISGAFFIDIGVASSKPGKKLIKPEDEKKRLIPYLKILLDEFPDTYFSIDTYNSTVAKACLDLGASMINDISGGVLDPKMFSVVASHKVPYIMMHMQGIPETMQKKPHYKDVVQDIIFSFNEKLKEAKVAGLQNIIIDPGFGFGKNTKHNFELLKNLDHFISLNCPILIGVSRKSMIYKTLGVDPKEALNGTTALHAWGLDRGARLLRVHDVKEAKECIDLWRALQ